MDFLDILRDKAFLGREFVTWLWFRSDQSGGMIELPGKRTVEVLFLDRMTLDLSDADTPQIVTLKGHHSELREGLAALKEGKKIEEARISVRVGDNDFAMTLKATWFSFGSFRTPPILPAGDSDRDEEAEATFLEKMALVEEGLAIIDDLFAHFMNIRLSAQWETEELKALRTWIESAVR